MILPADIRRWDAEWTYRLDEREAIMFDSGVENARHKAVLDIRRVAEREGK